MVKRDTAPLRPVANTPQQTELINTREFRQPVSDVHGHSQRLYFRVLPGYVREAAEIVASKQFPYSTISDLLRHGFTRHVRWLAGQMTDGIKRLGWLEAVSEILRSEEESLAYHVVVDRMRKVVRELLRQGANGRARELVNSVIGSIRNDMSEDYWQERYHKEVHEEFGHLLTNTQVSLKPSKMEE